MTTETTRRECAICPADMSQEKDLDRRVCFHCSNRILRHLRELEDYLPRLSLLKGRGGNDGRKPGFGSQSPANDNVIHHTDWRSAPSALDGIGALATIHEWAKNVREDRELQPPTHVSLNSEIDALRQHHAWLCCQEWVGAYAEELREIHSAVRAAANDPIPPAVGRCISILPHGECRGNVYETRDASGAECGTCHRTYSGLDLVRLGVAQEAG